MQTGPERLTTEAMEELEAGQAAETQEPRFSEDGEEILYEAECDNSRAFLGILLDMFLVVIFTAAGLGLIFIVIIIKYYATIINWKLYLTKRGIHHAMPNGCCVSHWFISMEEIQEIGNDGTDVIVKVGPEKVSSVAALGLCIAFS